MPKNYDVQHLVNTSECCYKIFGLTETDFIKILNIFKNSTKHENFNEITAIFLSILPNV
jgi:hypothetical protein